MSKNSVVCLSAGRWPRPASSLPKDQLLFSSLMHVMHMRRPEGQASPQSDGRVKISGGRGDPRLLSVGFSVGTPAATAGQSLKCKSFLTRSNRTLSPTQWAATEDLNTIGPQEIYSNQTQKCADVNTGKKRKAHQSETCIVPTTL